MMNALCINPHWDYFFKYQRKDINITILTDQQPHANTIIISSSTVNFSYMFLESAILQLQPSYIIIQVNNSSFLSIYFQCSLKKKCILFKVDNNCNFKKLDITAKSTTAFFYKSKRYILCKRIV